MYIVDARMRPPIAMFASARMFDMAFLQKSLSKRGFELGDAAREKSVGKLMNDMREAGVDHAVVPGRAPNNSAGGGGPESQLEFKRQFAGYVTTLAGCDAATIEDAGAWIDVVIADGHKGIVVESGLMDPPVPIDHVANFPLFEAAQAKRLVVYAMGGGNAGPDISFSNPLLVDRIAANFPNLQIAVPHGGFPYVQEICGVMYRRPNVWLIPDSYFPGLPGEADYLMLARTFGQDRFLFATAYPYATHKEQIRRYLELPLPDAIKEKIMGLNAARLFGLAPT